MRATPNELIKKLQVMYSNDMNQPIVYLIHDRDDLFNLMFDKDRKFGRIYATPQLIPNEIVDSCFESLFIDDRVHEAIRESYEWDIDKQIEQILELKDESELWN